MMLSMMGKMHKSMQKLNIAYMFIQLHTTLYKYSMQIKYSVLEFGWFIGSNWLVVYTSGQSNFVLCIQIHIVSVNRQESVMCYEKYSKYFLH